MGAGGTIAETRTGEFLVLEVALPGRAPEAAGVLLRDAAEDRLVIRLRRDWDQIAEADEEEVLSLLAGDLENKAAEMGAEGFLNHLEDSLSNTVRISERRPVLIGNLEATLSRLYREHVSASVQRFRTHLPLYSLRAAAGKWGDQVPVEEEGWMEAPVGLRLAPEMFVAQVVGRSMEPLIPDGSYCVFRSGVVGSRQGRRVLVENLAESEQGGQRYTVKRYSSEKTSSPEGGWRHTRIRLEPLNPDYETWEIEEGAQCRVLAEFVCLLDS